MSIFSQSSVLLSIICLSSVNLQSIFSQSSVNHQLFSYPLSHCNPRWVHIIIACLFCFSYFNCVIYFFIRQGFVFLRRGINRFSVDRYQENIHTLLEAVVCCLQDSYYICVSRYVISCFVVLCLCFRFLGFMFYVYFLLLCLLIIICLFTLIISCSVTYLFLLICFSLFNYVIFFVGQGFTFHR